MPEEGLEPPTARIMIPPGFPVFTGDSGDVGRQVGLFCQLVCTIGERALASSSDQYGEAVPIGGVEHEWP
jgi:hypothetical protein